MTSEKKEGDFLNAEILAVGTELLLGDILNTNAQYLSKKLAELGISTYFQTVVGDNSERLKNALETAFSRADLVITTGGLGPTPDDLTKETGAEYFGLKMIPDEMSLKMLKDYFKDKDMPKSNLKQAYVPEGSVVFQNNNGTAPGCMIEKNGKILIMLPGPPYEAKPMFEEYVFDYFCKKQDFTLVSKVLHLAGIGESAAAEEVSDIINKSENPTIAPYAKQNEMLFRITAKGKNTAEAEMLLKPMCDEIYKRLGKYIYGEDETTLEEAVIKEVAKKQMTLSIAESCTGGMLSSRIVDCAGASSVFVDGVVSYSNESKEKRLNVKRETLEKYGAVSAETASEMAYGICKMLKTQIGISTTGIAGPDGGTPEKPVGLVYIGLCINGETFTKELKLKGNRSKIRARTVAEALAFILEKLRQYK